MNQHIVTAFFVTLGSSMLLSCSGGVATPPGGDTNSVSSTSGVGSGGATGTGGAGGGSAGAGGTTGTGGAGGGSAGAGGTTGTGGAPSVCADVSGVDYGGCELEIGWGYDGKECKSWSGCS